MRPRDLVHRSVVYYWRTNVAVVAGVATAVAVLAGALLVGDSVRGSLRDLVEQRLGATDLAIVSPQFFREQLVADLASAPGFAARFSRVAPLVVLPGTVTAQESSRRSGRVRVYGIDDRFWQLHGVHAPHAIGDREVLINTALARELDAKDGDALLIRVQRPSDVPLESLHGKRDDTGRTLRLTLRGVVPADALGDFSLDAQQDAVLAAFVPLSRLQQEIDQPGAANTLLVSGAGDREGVDPVALESLLREHAELEDLGLKVRSTQSGNSLIIESGAGVLDDGQVSTIRQALEPHGMRTRSVLTYLANAMRHGDRTLPYSLVSAIDLTTLLPANVSPPLAGHPSIVLNTWAAEDLRTALGDVIEMDYYVWEDAGRLATRTSSFRVAAVVPIEAGDRDMAPDYPGITEAAGVSEWDPPFPIDLRKVRPADEAYWDRYRTTPKAFVDLATGQQLWRSRYGAVSSVRVPAERGVLAEVSGQVRQRVRAAVDPLTSGLSVRNVRAEGLQASRGVTDFGEYFVYFSFFIVASALLLAALFFKLGIEQRGREVGLLRAIGLSPAAVRRQFLAEGVILAAAGAVIGAGAAVGYAALMMAGLRTWWIDAVGTSSLVLHVRGQSIAVGVGGGMLAAVLCIWWTLRRLSRVSERALLAGAVASELPVGRSPRSRRSAVAAGVLGVVAAALLAAGALNVISSTGAFFGAGAALLLASLAAAHAVLARRGRRIIRGSGWDAVAKLGIRSTSYRPGRSVLAMAVIASATFILLAVDAFRRDPRDVSSDPGSGTGGYALAIESLLPVVQDPNTTEGREALNLSDLDASIRFEPFRLRPGDDTSCLNLYSPRNPRILAPRQTFVAAGRFAFQASLAAGPAEAANPWRLLERSLGDDVIPVIADANSLAYVLHVRVGEDVVIDHRGRPIALRVVASLRDSIFQSELLMSEANFVRLFPEHAGYQYLLVEAPAADLDRVRTDIESALNDFGADVTTTGERLAAFHRVENTYLSTFQTLGGLGLLIGTLGLAAVLMRNMLERRRELALLGAVGYQPRHFLLLALTENLMIVGCGLAAGAASAALAVAPAVAERGGRVPLGSGAWLLIIGVLIVVLMSSAAAMAAATRSPILEALRSE